MSQNKIKKKVLVALSGGVDSSVAAALLKKQGCEVLGLHVFLQQNETAKENYQSACQVAEKIGLKLETIDLADEFQKIIIDDFVKSYENGLTPNPCIRCNKYFKFGKWLESAEKMGCNYLATGHYARIKVKSQSAGWRTKVKSYRLLNAKDKTKDQSYFLYELGQKELAKVLFPLGELTKKKVKKLAQKWNLPVAQRKESNDVCFLNNLELTEFLKSKIKAEKGAIIDIQGKVRGEHNGLFCYTLGQRQGIKIGGPGPYYVVRKDFEKNRLIVTNNPQDSLLFSSEILVEKINWVSGEEPKLPLKCLATHRYQAKKFPVLVKKENGCYLIKTKKPQRAVTPGQSVVLFQPLLFSRSAEVLGGGVIVSGR